MNRRRLLQSGGIPEGALSGQFTINSSGDKVYFSKGNLQYNKNTSTWSFMEHQYSTVETSYQDVGENYADQDVVSLFGWGNKYMMPYNTSTDYNEYGGRFVDWGTVAASSIGAGWRTLTGGTSGEWEYLINGRTVNGGKGNNYSYTLGQSVNGMLGIVLYPDNYTGATYTTAQSANWSSFEAAGCVFLPAAGWRSDTLSVDVGSYGNYWASTTTFNASLACCAKFWKRSGKNSINFAGYDNIYLGFSVRLVYDITGG